MSDTKNDSVVLSALEAHKMTVMNAELFAAQENYARVQGRGAAVVAEILERAKITKDPKDTWGLDVTDNQVYLKKMTQGKVVDPKPATK